MAEKRAHISCSLCCCLLRIHHSLLRHPFTRYYLFQDILCIYLSNILFYFAIYKCIEFLLFLICHFAGTVHSHKLHGLRPGWFPNRFNVCVSLSLPRSLYLINITFSIILIIVDFSLRLR